jgi:hypothetical protein
VCACPPYDVSLVPFPAPLQDEMIAAAKATGLEVEVVMDLGKLPFKTMVAKMAGTGILIAAHGAALVNAMFLPQVRGRNRAVLPQFRWRD